MQRLCHAAFNVAIVFLAVIAPSSANAQTDTSINEFVTHLDNSMRTIRAQAGAEDARVRGRCVDLMGRAFNLDAMARVAVAGTWERMNAAQRNAYRSAFEQRIVSDCVRRVRDYRGESMTLLGIRQADGGERLAATRVGVEGEAGRIVIWRLRGGGQRAWRAVDVIVDGRSMLIAARDEYAAVLQSHDGDIDALLASMRR